MRVASADEQQLAAPAQRLERSLLRDGHMRFEFYAAHVPTAGIRTGILDGVLYSARARIMSGVGHLVEHRRLGVRRLSAGIGVERVRLSQKRAID